MPSSRSEIPNFSDPLMVSKPAAPSEDMQCRVNDLLQLSFTFIVPRTVTDWSHGQAGQHSILDLASSFSAFRKGFSNGS